MATKEKPTKKALNGINSEKLTKKQIALRDALADVKKIMTPEFIKKHNFKPFERI